MNVKITIEDATPAELALVLNNLNKLDTGSTMSVTGKTSSFNLGDKGPAQSEAELQDAQEDQKEEEAAKPVEEKKTRAPRQSSRKPKDEVEKETKATPPTERGGRDSGSGRGEREERGGRDSERTSDASDERRVGGRGNLLEKVGELAAELKGLYKDPRRGDEVVAEILDYFGVTTIDDLNPADFTAAIERFKRKIEKD